MCSQGNGHESASNSEMQAVHTNRSASPYIKMYKRGVFVFCCEQNWRNMCSTEGETCCFFCIRRGQYSLRLFMLKERIEG